MNFKAILLNFSQLPSGTDTFKQLKQLCEQQLGQPQPSLEKTALFLISGFAKNYVLLYEDQAIRPEFAQNAKNQLLGYMQRLSDALESADEARILEALNQVSSDYMQSSRVF